MEGMEEWREGAKRPTTEKKVAKFIRPETPSQPNPGYAPDVQEGLGWINSRGYNCTLSATSSNLRFREFSLVPQSMYDAHVSFEGERQYSVSRRHQHTPQQCLVVPHSAQQFIGELANGQRPIVVLKDCSQEQEHGDAAVNCAEIRDENVGKTFAHRFVKCENDENEYIRQETEETFESRMKQNSHFTMHALQNLRKLPKVHCENNRVDTVVCVLFT